MPQIKKSYTEVTIPLQKMSFTPDVPSAALGANEYNSGSNVETDVRGIRSVNGDEAILATVTGTPFYVTGGYRQGADNFWIIVATTQGQWWMTNGTGGWTNITPPAPFDGTQYTQATDITESWNGTVVVFNDGINDPFFLLDQAGAKLIQYADKTDNIQIASVAVNTPTAGQATITYTTAQATAPFVAGEYITVTGSPTEQFNRNWQVISDSTTQCVISCTLTTITVAASTSLTRTYVWNYQPELFSKITARFIRQYNTPNVGSILVAGNLTITDLNMVTTQFPVTVRNSQNYGLNQVPTTWELTNLNVANEVEVPLRGEALDAFPSNGQLFVCSYWDTIVLSPLNFATTNAPILGVRLFNQGRGLLNPNCWANADDMVYGVDSRDIWAFNGQTFTGIGNQRVKHFFFDQLDPEYIDRVYVESNTEKNQVEIYYPDANATAGVPNKMISYRYDLDVWNPPRDVTIATFACESPIWSSPSAGVWEPNRASRTMIYAQGFENSRIIQKDQGYYFRDQSGAAVPIVSEFRRDNIKLVKDYSTKTLAHRVLPEIVNLNDNNVEIDPVVNPELIGNVEITVEGASSVGQTPQQVTGETLSTNTDYPWVQINQNAYRVNSLIMQTPVGDTATPGTIWMCTATTWQFTETEDDR